MEEMSTSLVAAKWRSISGGESITGTERKKNILVVDDSDSIRELLSILLHKAGIVYTAVNGLDALSYFAGHHFDVIVSDIEMPVMNGIELYKNVGPAYKELFLFFSGTMQKEYISYLSMNGLTLFRKPGDILKLQDAVQKKLRTSFPKSVTY